MTRPPAALCPSSRCEPGAILLGIVLPTGWIAYGDDLVVIDAEFARRAHEGRSPEKRFRFASPCVQQQCHQWSAGRCTVIDELARDPPPSMDRAALPSCSIRAGCRWYLQIGPAACAVCPLVITDCTSSEKDKRHYAPRLVAEFPEPPEEARS